MYIAKRYQIYYNEESDELVYIHDVSFDIAVLWVETLEPMIPFVGKYHPLCIPLSVLWDEFEYIGTLD